jgi:hypothetical protein
VYRDHIERLAREHGVELTVLEPEPGRGWVARCFPGRAYPVARQPRVETPDPVDWSAYLAGLHEFGHVLGGELSWAPARPDGTHTGVSLHAELAAWAWALANTVVPPTPTDAVMVFKYMHAVARRAGAPDELGASLVPRDFRAVYDDRLMALWALHANGSRWALEAVCEATCR